MRLRELAKILKNEAKKIANKKIEAKRTNKNIKK